MLARRKKPTPPRELVNVNARLTVSVKSCHSCVRHCKIKTILKPKTTTTKMRKISLYLYFSHIVYCPIIDFLLFHIIILFHQFYWSVNRLNTTVMTEEENRKYYTRKSSSIEYPLKSRDFFLRVVYKLLKYRRCLSFLLKSE